MWRELFLCTHWGKNALISINDLWESLLNIISRQGVPTWTKFRWRSDSQNNRCNRRDWVFSSQAILEFVIEIHGIKSGTFSERLLQFMITNLQMLCPFSPIERYDLISFVNCFEPPFKLIFLGILKLNLLNF